ncbi:MAG: hypothetical protein JNG90_20100 [Planctomycetaceae bacterium]|nr:hypothetical protein [Planctomycetaceae bacterium]
MRFVDSDTTTPDASHPTLQRANARAPGQVPRDPRGRQRYLDAALAEIPRLLGAMDRNPYHATYGCLDREYWHYRTSDFPCEMHQEGVLPLALAYTHSLPGNSWHGVPRVRELCLAALRFSARSGHRDGSCDDYYPFERALGAAVFSLLAAVETCLLLEVDDAEILAALAQRGAWLLQHDETGQLSNHQALAALGLWQLGRLTGRAEFRVGAAVRLGRVLDWQHPEGWFNEYGGADPGYQTVTIACLAKYRRLSGDALVDAPLERAVRFARRFLHPDLSYAGEYGSRGTYHFYPHGMELLAAQSPAAADLADGYLQALAVGRQAYFTDDRMYAHRLAGLIESYLDWSPTRPGCMATANVDSHEWLLGAQIYVRDTPGGKTVISAARGGVFKHFPAEPCVRSATPCVTDAGLVLEFTNGRVAVSQLHDLGRQVACEPATSLIVAGPLHWARHETATPLKLILFRTLLLTAGRWCRALVRGLLQRRLITGRRACPVRFTRRFEFAAANDSGKRSGAIRVVDTLELLDPRLTARRMSYGVDHQATYVAATGVYQQSVLQPWSSLDDYVDELNRKRRVTITRELS